MQLSNLQINNFKSLVDFRIELEKFNCIIGLNGAGKSTLLQALDFISQQAKGDIKQWLKKRDWQSRDLHPKQVKGKNVSVTLELKDGDATTYLYSFEYNTSLLRCTYESIIVNGNRLLKLEHTGYRINGESYKIMQEHEGSILSSLKEDKIPIELVQLKNFIKNITSMDLLSPQSMKLKSRINATDIGYSGEFLTSFLNKLTDTDKEKLLSKLKTGYPRVKGLDIIKMRAGWKKLELIEELNRGTIVTEAKHINDGLLRILAIFAQTYSDKTFLLFDEIENGINPELIELLVDTLQEISQQVLITTHSPLVLNYIEDEVAKKTVHYIYKNDDGFTRSIKFFKIPSVLKKLTVMGAGEIYADTNLSKLDKEISRMEAEL